MRVSPEATKIEQTAFHIHHVFTPALRSRKLSFLSGLRPLLLLPHYAASQEIKATGPVILSESTSTSSGDPGPREAPQSTLLWPRLLREVSKNPF